MTKTKFVIYEDRAGEWRWRLVAPNGRIVAISGEGYTRREDCSRAITATVIDPIREPGAWCEWKDATTDELSIRQSPFVSSQST